MGWTKEYRLSHPEIVRANKKRYYLKHKDKIKEYHNKWSLINKNLLKEYHKKYYLKNKSKFLYQKKDRFCICGIKLINKYVKYCPSCKIKVKKQVSKIWNTTPKAKEWRKKYLFKVNNRLRKLLRKALIGKSTSYKKEFSFSLEQFKLNLESKFTPEMSWENYGKYWQIDHKVPVTWFKNKDQLIKKGFSLDNMQPLPKSLNLSKNNKYVYDIQKNGLPKKVIHLTGSYKGVGLND